jgi:hypothetical protein
MVPAALLAVAGCNSSLVFVDRLKLGPDGGTAGNGDGPPDSPAPGDTGGDMGPPDAPVDMAIDTPPDRPPDVPIDTPPDVPKTDVQPDLPRDTGSDLPREAAVDAGGPIVCTQNSDCRLTSLRCLVGAGQPGQCVECLANANCATGHCDLNQHRCVECNVGTDCPVQPGDDSNSHPSTCSPSGFHCLAGCDDSVPAPCPAPHANFSCQNTSSVDHLCVGCMADTDCASSGTQRFCGPDNVCSECKTNGDCATATPFCDFVSSRCVQCLTSVNCNRVPGLPLCDPTALACVSGL